MESHVSLALPTRDEGRDRPATVVSPSILSADFAQLAAAATQMQSLGAAWLHIDVMDGHFVPNLTIGAPVVSSLRKHTPLYLDCHLMVSNPQQWVQDFAKAGANMFSFHLEALDPACASASPSGAAAVHPAVVALARSVREAGMHAGLALRPATPVEAVLPYLQEGLLDMVLVLTVNPGFGGQKFMADVVEKCRVLRARYPDLCIQVDGGIAPETVAAAAAAGANVVVAGSAIFGAGDPGAVIRQLHAAVDAAATQTAAPPGSPSGR